MILDENRDNPPRIFIEVYDHAHPPSGLQRVLAIEALTCRSWIALAIVGPGDRCEDLVKVVEQPGATAFCEMRMRSCIEHDLPTVWIDDALLLGGHGP